MRKDVQLLTFGMENYYPNPLLAIKLYALGLTKIIPRLKLRGITGIHNDVAVKSFLKAKVILEVLNENS
jgi:hypothetical protein